MKIEVKEVDGCGRELKVEVEGEEVKKEWQSRLKRLKKEAKVPGFRPGKVPEDILKIRFKSELHQDISNSLILSSSKKALEEKSLKPITDLIISNNELGEDKFSYQAYFEIRPDITLGNYRGLKIKREEKKVSEKDVDDVLNQAKKKSPISIGNPNEEREAKEKVRQYLEREIEITERRKEEDQIIEQLLGRCSLTAPKLLVGQETEIMLKRELAREEPKPSKNHLKETREKLRPEAEKRVKASFILEEVAEKEGIKVEEEEVDNRITSIAQMNKVSPVGLRKELEKDGRVEGLSHQIKAEKVFNFLISKAIFISRPEIIVHTA